MSRDTAARVLNNAITVDANPTLGSSSSTTNGALTFNAPVQLTLTRTFTVNGTVGFTAGISEPASSGFGVIKTGAATLTVSGTSTYTGSTVVSGGVLRFNALSAIGGTGQNLTINVDSALAFGFSPSQTLLDRIVSTSTGAIAFTTDPSSFNYTNLASAFIGVASGSTQTFSGAVPVGTGSTYRLGGGGGTLTVSGTNALTGANSLTTANLTGGVIILSAANNFTGSTTVGSPSVLRLGNSNSVGSTSGVTVANGARLELADGVVVNRPINISGSGANNIGALQLISGANAAEWAGPITLGLTDTRVGTNAVNGVLTISGVVDDGSFSYNFNVRNVDGSTGLGSTVLTAANTYGGSTGAVVGTLKIDGGDDRLPVGTTLILGANNNTIASFDLNGRNQRVAGIVRSGAAASNSITNSRANTTSTFSVDSTVVTGFDGFFTDTSGTNSARLALVKMNTGNLTLSRANSHTGGTTVQAGSLTGAVDGALGAGDVFVMSAANLILQGGATNNYIANNANLILASGTPNVNLNYSGTDTIGALSLDGGLTFLQPGVYGGFGSPAPAGNQYPQFTSTGTVTVTAVPEPMGVAGLGIAAMGLLARKRRRGAAVASPPPPAAATSLFGPARY
jgi:autotransporter-associated beta strand protein